MADLARLRRDARLAYEVARLGASLRVAFVIAPLTALCIWETRAVSRSVAMGFGLLVVVTILRWRQQNGFRVVSTGMCTGALPFAAALVLCRFAPSFGSDAAFALCGSAGVVSGGLMGRSMSHWMATPWRQWLGTVTVAGLTAALGCVALGVGTALGAAAGIALAAALVAGVPRRTTI